MRRGRVRREARELPLMRGRGRAHPRLATCVEVGPVGEGWGRGEGRGGVCQ